MDVTEQMEQPAVGTGFIACTRLAFESRPTVSDEQISQKKMLGYYAERFPTVEINYTFRQIPSKATVESWAAQVPDSFRFSLKAWQTITHFKRLQNAEKETEDFIAAASGLGAKLGPILFQTPPTFEIDVPTLNAFLNHIAGRVRVAFEFRNDTWADEEVLLCLSEHDAALCFADGDDMPPRPLVRTADWGYLRFRADSYSDGGLRGILQEIQSQNWAEAYVYFMHEDTGIGPKLALQLMELMKEPA